MRKILAIGSILFTLLGTGCTGEKSNQDLGIAAYKRGHHDVALYDFERRANEGDPVAQFGLGFMYERQVGVVAKNRTEAEFFKQRAEGWYEKSAEQGYVPAQNNLAAMYYRRAQDALIKSSAVELTPEELEALKNNTATAVQWFLKAGTQQNKQNNHVAQYNLALISSLHAYLSETINNSPSIAVELYEEAVSWLTIAAKKGYRRAQFELANMYVMGKGIDENLTETERWKKAVEWYTKAADEDYDAAQCELGVMYYEGRGVDTNLTETKRWEIAVEWFTKAAETKTANNAVAQFNLAEMYRRGKGVDTNLTKNERREKAVEWYTKAANQGNGAAQNNLAKMYIEDFENDVENKEESIKPELAARWFFLAAQQDYAVAQVNIGQRFEKGLDGVSQDDKEALFWYSLALRDPDRLAKFATLANIADTVEEWRKSVAKKLTPEQENQIREQIDNWQPKEGDYFYGTGFYITPNHILTNEHVVTWEDKDKNKHKYDEYRIPYRRVKLMSWDEKVDLALLYDEKGNPDTAKFRKDSVVVGERISSFGYPLSHHLSYGGNATPGIVSGLSGALIAHHPDNHFQHTAPVTGGNSGGPVFDLSGNVVGVTTYVYKSGQNVNFAIKFDVIEKFLSENGITVDPAEDMAEDSTKVANLQNIFKDIPAKSRRFTVPVLTFRKKRDSPALPVVVMKIDDIDGSKQ